MSRCEGFDVLVPYFTAEFLLWFQCNDSDFFFSCTV